jgi:hypothetical protein
MTGSIEKKSDEGLGHLPQTSGNKEWLLKAFAVTADRLSLSPNLLQKTDYEQFLMHIDEARLFRLLKPLSVLQPSEITAQLAQVGGDQFLYSTKARRIIVSWSERHRAIQVLSELSETTSMLQRFHQQDGSYYVRAALQTLAVMCMLAFISENEKLTGDLSTILRGSPEDIPGLIKSYRIAISSKSEVVTLVDERIKGDTMWSTWAEQLLKEIQDSEIFYNTSICGTKESHLLKNGELNEYYSTSFDDALLGEFFSIIASIAMRLTADNVLHNNKDKLPTTEGEQQ